MTFKVAKSTITERFGDQYSTLVSAYSGEIKEWRDREVLVKQDKENGVPIEDAHASFPPPIAHPLIVAAINESGDPDFIVDDDTPTADDLLPYKKDALLSMLQQAEDFVSERIMPAMKLGAVGYRLADITKADIERVNDLSTKINIKDAQVHEIENDLAQYDAAHEKSLLRQIVSSVKDVIIGESDPAPDPVRDAKVAILDVAREDLAKLLASLSDQKAYHAEARPADDTSFLAQHAEATANLEGVRRWIAQVKSEIHDLTIDNIDGYSIPAFSEGSAR